MEVAVTTGVIRHAKPQSNVATTYQPYPSFYRSKCLSLTVPNWYICVKWCKDAMHAKQTDSIKNGNMHKVANWQHRPLSASEEVDWTSWLSIGLSVAKKSIMAPNMSGFRTDQSVSSSACKNNTITMATSQTTHDESFRRQVFLAVISLKKQASVDRECPTCLQRHLSNIFKYFFRLSIPKHNPNLKP